MSGIIQPLLGTLRPRPLYIASAGTRSAGTTTVVNKPTGTIQNDLMIALLMDGDTGITPSYPTGWTQSILSNAANNSGAVAYKIAGASEPSSYTFGLTGAFGKVVQIVTIRYASNVATGTYATGTSATLTAPTITASFGILLAWFGAESTPTLTTAPTGMTLALNTTGGPVCWTYYQNIAAGSTGTRTLVINASQAYKTILVNAY